MPDRSAPVRKALLLSILIPCIPTVVRGQTINITTLPVASGDQFLIVPSANQAMGAVSIALDDPVLDPFTNPAKGGDIRGLRMLTSSTFYNTGGDDGRGRTFPIGSFVSSGEWFVSAFLAFQEIYPGGRSYPWYPDRLPDILFEREAF